jgi:hypothetical protein
MPALPLCFVLEMMLERWGCDGQTKIALAAHSLAELEIHEDALCCDAFAQLCAFRSPKAGVLSAIEIYHELTIVTPGWRVVSDGKNFKATVTAMGSEQ